jgi:transcriptional regulator with XRE-family HTH domain
MFKKIGQRIRKVRLEHGIKQKDLAKKINISQGALTNFELGRRKISLEWLLKISHALEVPVGYFMSAVEPAPEEDTLDPKDHRLLRAFRRMSRDPRLQMEFLHVMERMSHHLERAAGRGGRAAPA